MPASRRTANRKLVERHSRPPAFACEILGYLISFRMNVMRTLADMLADAECGEGVGAFQGKPIFKNINIFI